MEHPQTTRSMSPRSGIASKEAYRPTNLANSTRTIPAMISRRRTVGTPESVLSHVFVGDHAGR
jgi:hypothetical protein